jgi:hypothetical protein
MRVSRHQQVPTDDDYVVLYDCWVALKTGEIKSHQKKGAESQRSPLDLLEAAKPFEVQLQWMLLVSSLIEWIAFAPLVFLLFLGVLEALTCWRNLEKLLVRHQCDLLQNVPLFARAILAKLGQIDGDSIYKGDCAPEECQEQKQYQRDWICIQDHSHRHP